MTRSFAMVGQLAAFACGIALTFSGAIKAADPDAFRHTLDAQLGLSSDSLNSVALLLTGVELCYGALVLGLSLRRATCVSGLALASFAFLALSGYAAYLWNFPPRVAVRCGCGLSRRLMAHDDWSVLSLRNACFAVGTAMIFLGFARGHRSSAGSGLNPSPPATDCAPCPGPELRPECLVE